MAETAAQRNAAAEAARQAEKRKRAMAEFEASVAKGKAEAEARDVSSLVAANARVSSEPEAASTKVAAVPVKGNVLAQRRAALEQVGMADGGRVGRHFPKKGGK